jgi:hypothetical protein
MKLKPIIKQQPMCDQCSKIYKTEKKHDPSVCPIALSLTCSCCKVRGHATLKCPNLTLWTSRVPEYYEQLIPLSLRVHHNIPFDQKTPISNVNLRPTPCSHIMSDLARQRMDDVRNQIKGLPLPERPAPELYCSQCKPTLEIPEDKDGSHTANIRATLASFNLPNSSGKENLKQLSNFAAMNGKKLILKKFLVPDQKDDTPKLTEKETESSKKTFKLAKKVNQQEAEAVIQPEKTTKVLKCKQKTSGKTA